MKSERIVIRGFDMERQEEKERELVPVRRRKPEPKREPLKELPESPIARISEMPRRWYLF